MKTNKIILVFLLTLMLLYIGAEQCYALGGKGLLGYYLADDEAMDIDISIGTTSNINETTQFTQKILKYFQIIGSIVSVVALIIIGFRYMFSSLEEKAKMKGILIYYIVGAALVFATSNILSIAYNVISGITI